MIRNYTSGTSADRSVMAIETQLAAAGASHIGKIYADGELAGITFCIAQQGVPVVFKLPARVEAVAKLLSAERRKPPTEAQSRAIWEQAQRTAWKLMYEWVAIQLSLVRIQQAEIIEVFLPYAYNPEKNQTFFESVKESKYKALLGSGEKK